MADAGSLDGNAKEGFNTDISLTRPSLPQGRPRAKTIRTTTHGTPGTEQNGHSGQEALNGNANAVDNEAELLEKATQPVTGLRMRCIDTLTRSCITSY